MKKLSEVCRITGVSRRTLQEYDRIDLIKPKRSDNGYWAYDDADISVIMVIQLFRDAGYSRKEIKQILENDRASFIKEFELLVDRLEKKRQRINGQLHMAKTIVAWLGLNKEISDSVQINMEDLLSDKYNNLTALINHNIEIASDYNDEIIQPNEVELGLILTKLFTLKDQPVDSDEVQKLAAVFYDSVTNRIIDTCLQDEDIDAEDDEIEKLSKDPEFVKLNCEGIKELLNNADMLEELSKIYDVNRIRFFKDAVELYLDNTINENS